MRWSRCEGGNKYDKRVRSMGLSCIDRGNGYASGMNVYPFELCVFLFC